MLKLICKLWIFWEYLDIQGLLLDRKWAGANFYLSLHGILNLIFTRIECENFEKFMGPVWRRHFQWPQNDFPTLSFHVWLWKKACSFESLFRQGNSFYAWKVKRLVTRKMDTHFFTTQNIQPPRWDPKLIGFYWSNKFFIIFMKWGKKDWIKFYEL